MSDQTIVIDNLGIVANLSPHGSAVVVTDRDRAEAFRRQFIIDRHLEPSTSVEACVFLMLDQAIKNVDRPEGVWPWLPGE